MSVLQQFQIGRMQRTVTWGCLHLTQRILHCGFNHGPPNGHIRHEF